MVFWNLFYIMLVSKSSPYASSPILIDTLILRWKFHMYLFQVNDFKN